MGSKITRKIENNKINRELTKKYEMKKLVNKYITISLSNKEDLNDKYLINLFYLHKFGPNSSISVIKNICTLTGRYRGVLSFYKLSRLKLKELGSMALLPGLRRSSW